MSVAMFLKVFSDCCLILTILVSGPVAFTVSPLIPALICGLAAGLACFFESRALFALRRLCCLLPLGGLLLVNGTAQLVLLAIPAVYTAVVILRGNTQLEYGSFRYYFTRSLTLLAVGLVVLTVWSGFADMTGEEFRPDVGLALRYALLYLLCGVVLQRQLRLGVGAREAGGKRQISTLVLTAVVIGLGCVVAEPMFRNTVSMVLQTLMLLLLSPLAILVLGVYQLLMLFRNREPNEKTLEEILDHWENNVWGGRDWGEAKPVEPPPQEAGNPYLLWIVVAGVFLLIAAVLLMRAFLKRRANSGGGEVQTQIVTVPKKKKAAVFSNRARVRQLYREFLRTEKDLGLKLRPNDTSADVLERIHPRTHRPSAADLRQVYLAARYHDGQAVTKGQVDEAKRALKAARKPKN